jgi:hypothetical protein
MHRIDTAPAVTQMVGVFVRAKDNAAEYFKREPVCPFDCVLAIDAQAHLRVWTTTPACSEYADPVPASRARVRMLVANTTVRDQPVLKRGVFASAAHWNAYRSTKPMARQPKKQMVAIADSSGVSGFTLHRLSPLFQSVHG